MAELPATAALGWLLTCALAATLLLLACWLAVALLRKRSPAARHQLWALGAGAALLLPLLAAAAGHLPARAALPSLPSLLSLTSLPTLAPVAPAASPPAASPSPERPAPAMPSPDEPAWPRLVLAMWALGTAVVLFRLGRDHGAARRLCRAASPSVPPAWRQAVAELGATPRFELRCSERIASPMTAGLRRACVLLPAAARSWEAAQLRAALLHELGHVRRRDTSIQLVAQLTCALYWWSPLAWYAAARLRIEREHACDDLVLAAGVLPSSYAAALLELARTLALRPLPRGGICMADRPETEARLLRILDPGAPRRPLGAPARRTARAVALGAVAALACTAAPPAGDERSDAPEPRPPRQPRQPLAAAALPTISVGAPSLRPWSMLAAPSRPGAIELTQVAAAVEQRTELLARCYQRRLAARPRLAGTVVAHAVILEDGSVADVCITRDSAGDPELTECVNQLFKGGAFPAPTGGSVDVTIPFSFGA